MKDKREALKYEVGARLRDYRLREGIAQGDVAASLKRSSSWLAEVERGGQHVYLADALLLLGIYEVSINSLVVGLLPGHLDGIIRKNPDKLSDWEAIFPENPDRAETHWRLDRELAKYETKMIAQTSGA